MALIYVTRILGGWDDVLNEMNDMFIYYNEAHMQYNIFQHPSPIQCGNQ